MLNPYASLAIAIVAEVMGTMLLMGLLSFGMLLVCFYLCSFIFLAFAIQGINLGIAYATWAGVGTIFAAIGGYTIFNEVLNWYSALGLL